MCVYQHTQQGTLMLVGFGGGAAVAGGTAWLLAGWGSPAVIPTVVAIVLGVCALLFHSLHVRVTDEWLTLRFGIGLIRKQFAVGHIQHVQQVENRWYYGWGIRYTPHGWLFNVAGLDAVEIQLGSGRKFRIGTDQPQELCAAIRQVLNGEPSPSVDRGD